MKRLVSLLCIVAISLFLTACNPLAKNTVGGLQVITDGAPASVYLDDNYVEKTPFINRELKPGEYTLKIKPDDPSYVTHETKVTLRAGLLTVVTWKLAQRAEYSGGVIYEMEPINSKSKAELSFVTIPDTAIIAVEGREKQFSPVILEDVAPGHLGFEITLPSYESQSHTINIVPGYRMLVTMKLAKVSLDTTETPVATDTPALATPSAIINTATPAATIQTPVPATSSGQLKSQTVTILPTGFFVEGKEVVRVRNAPNANGTELGFAPVGTVYPYLGKTENSWYNITFNNQSGWVSKQYAQLSN